MMFGLPLRVCVGLDVLVGLDARFGSYRDTLFSLTSLDVDREQMVPKEEEKVNKSVASYLRLLSGYLQLPAALKTLEYLVRRYRYCLLSGSPFQVQLFRAKLCQTKLKLEFLSESLVVCT